MTYHQLAELVSLGITPSAIYLSVVVVVLWGKEALSVLWNAPRSAHCWFIVGVFIGFFGGAFDNLYWGIAWTASYLGHESKDFWFTNGVYSNIPFRQVCTQISAYCHLRSFYEYAGKNSGAYSSRFHLVLSVAMDLLSLVFLYLMYLWG